MKTQRAKLVAAFAALMALATASLFAEGKWFVGKTLQYDDGNKYKSSITLSDNGTVVFTYNSGKVKLKGSYTIDEAKKTITCTYPGEGTDIYLYNDILLLATEECDFAASDVFLSDSAKFDAKSAKFLFGKKFDVGGNIIEFSNEGKVLCDGSNMCSYMIDESAKTIVGYPTPKGTGENIGIVPYEVDKKGKVTITVFGNTVKESSKVGGFLKSLAK